MPTNPADFVDRFTSAQACEAAGISMDTLRNWVSRQPQVVLLTHEERERAGKGHPLLFSFNRVMQIALTAAIVEQGPDPRQAALMAAAFTDLGDGAASADELETVRQPGELYQDAFTFIVGIRGRRGAEAAAECVRVTPETPALALLRGGLAALAGSEGAVILEVDRIHARVRAALAV